MKLAANHLFFLDSAGALLTAFLVGVVLVQWQHLIGMPIGALYFLAALGVGFGLYSMMCGIFVKKLFKPFLKVIIIANTAYCFLSLALVAFYFSEVTALAVAYFLLEVLVISVVVITEIKFVKTLS